MISWTLINESSKTSIIHSFGDIYLNESLVITHWSFKIILRIHISQELCDFTVVFYSIVNPGIVFHVYPIVSSTNWHISVSSYSKLAEASKLS